MIGKKQNPSALLGIAFEGTRVHVAQVHRGGGSFQVSKTFSVDLSESPLEGDALVLGKELRLVLQQQGIKEQRCVAGLPVQWFLSTLTKIPGLPEADVAEFLNLEAERGFAYDPESLFVSSSRCHFNSGEKYANIAGIQREQVLRVQNLLQAARLKPLSFTISIAAAQRVFRAGDAPELLLMLGSRAVEVGISCGDGLFAMRSIERAEEGFAESLGRELRVTLGQIPAELRGQLVTARLFGPTETVAQIKTELTPRLRAMGFAPEIGSPEQGAFASAVAPAAGYLLGKGSGFEFLPPKVSAWREWAGKASAKKLGWVASIAGVAVVLLLLVFLVQGWQLSQLESRWGTMSPRVTELEAMQQQIKKFRPWFDNSFRSLTILRKLTEAFPADGVVTAKTLEIRNQSLVTCSGVARDNQTLFKMLDQLRSTKEVADVKMDQIRGKSPLQYSFNYRWVEGGSGEH